MKRILTYHVLWNFMLLSIFINYSCSDAEKIGTLSLSEINVLFTSSEETKKITVESSEDWKYKVIAGSDWCACLKETDGVKISVRANRSGRKRNAIIVFTSGTQMQELKISQETLDFSINYPQVTTNFDKSLLDPDKNGTILPDFSNIGYMGSEKAIPEVQIVKIIEAPSSGMDMTNNIQLAIDNVSSMALANGLRGCILLKRGTYNISGTLKIKNSGIVLRGEGELTKLVATGNKQRNLIEFTGEGSLTPSNTTNYNIKDAYVPVGRFWLSVNDPDSFSVGDNVVIYRPATQKWISDLKMDQIPPASDGTPSNQWQIKDYNLFSERKITAIKGDTLHFDNPVMMSIDSYYGGGAVFKASFPGRLSHCGVENMVIESEYQNDTDNNHGWVAISMSKVEHSWVRNITSRYFGMGLIIMDENSRFITVKDCKCLDAKSTIEGGNRYSFHIRKGQQCLVIDCETTEGRHDCVTGPWSVGPSAFVRVRCKNAHDDVGPHHRWNVGTLYDNIITDGDINVQDRGNWGYGHGWAGANQVLWNCSGRKICVQNPWVSAKNYSIGTKGEKYNGRLSDRPDGIWIKHNETVTPNSLFDAQLELRISKGRLYHIK